MASQEREAFREKLRALRAEQDRYDRLTEVSRMKIRAAAKKGIRDHRLSYNEVGADLGISRQRVWQLINDTR